MRLKMNGKLGGGLLLAVAAAGPPPPPPLVPASFAFFNRYEDADLTKTGADIDTFKDIGAGGNDAPNVGFGKLVQGGLINGYKTLLGDGGAQWYRTTGNGDTLVNATGGVFYFAAKLTSSSQSMILDCPTTGNGSIQVIDVSGTPTLRVSFGTGGAGNITVDVPFPLNQLNFVTIRFTNPAGTATLRGQVNNGAEVSHTAVGSQFASLVANKVHLYGGTWASPRGQVLFFASDKGYPDDAAVVARKAEFKGAYADLPI